MLFNIYAIDGPKRALVAKARYALDAVKLVTQSSDPRLRIIVAAGRIVFDMRRGVDMRLAPHVNECVGLMEERYQQHQADRLARLAR